VAPTSLSDLQPTAANNEVGRLSHVDLAISAVANNFYLIFFIISTEHLKMFLQFLQITVLFFTPLANIK